MQTGDLPFYVLVMSWVRIAHMLNIQTLGGIKEQSAQVCISIKAADATLQKIKQSYKRTISVYPCIMCNQA